MKCAALRDRSRPGAAGRKSRSERLGYQVPKACGAPHPNLVETYTRSNNRAETTGALWIAWIPWLCLTVRPTWRISQLMLINERDKLFGLFRIFSEFVFILLAQVLVEQWNLEHNKIHDNTD